MTPNVAAVPELFRGKLLEQVLNSKMVWDDQGNQVPLDSNVSAEEASLLATAVGKLRPQCSAEIGLAKGVSTVAILEAIAANGIGHHVVMDPFQEKFGNAGIELVRRAGLESWWEFHRKFAEEVIPGLRSIQFAFVDASHLFDLTLMEFVLVDKKLDIGGVVAFHDLWMPSLQTLFRFILSNRSYKVWHPEGSNAKPQSSKNLKERMRRLLLRLPRANSIFSAEFRSPWAAQQLGNLVFLKKVAHDERHWTFHRSF